jgi:hypothetical protein
MRHAVPARRIHGDDAQRKRTEALVARHIRELFARLPGLAGFRLRDDLMVDDLSVFSWSVASSQGLEGIVLQSLVDLAERNPEAVVLMRGRTFARSLH